MRKTLTLLALLTSVNTYAVDITYEIDTVVDGQDTQVILSFDNESPEFVNNYDGTYSISSADFRVQSLMEQRAFDNANLSIQVDPGGYSYVTISDHDRTYEVAFSSPESLGQIRPESFIDVDAVIVSSVEFRDVETGQTVMTMPHINSTLDTYVGLPQPAPVTLEDRTITLSGTDHNGQPFDVVLSYSMNMLTPENTYADNGSHSYNLPDANVSVSYLGNDVSFNNVSVFTYGDEISISAFSEYGQVMALGQIYDSNATALHALEIASDDVVTVDSVYTSVDYHNYLNPLSLSISYTVMSHDSPTVTYDGLADEQPDPIVNPEIPTPSVQNTITIEGGGYYGDVKVTISYSEDDLAAAIDLPIGDWYQYHFPNGTVRVESGVGVVETNGVYVELDVYGSLRVRSDPFSNANINIMAATTSLPIDLTQDPEISLDLFFADIEAFDYQTGMSINEMVSNAVVTFANEAGGCPATQLVAYTYSGEYNNEVFTMTVSYDINDIQLVNNFGDLTQYESTSAEVTFIFGNNPAITFNGIRIEERNLYGLSLITFEELYVNGTNINNFRIQLVNNLGVPSNDVSPLSPNGYLTTVGGGYADFYLTDHNMFESGALSGIQLEKSFGEGDCSGN